MKTLFTTLFFLGLFSLTHGQGKNNNTTLFNFQNKIEQCKLIFIQPNNFEETAIKENPDQYYDYAIKHKELKVEIRYCIRKYDSSSKKLNKATPLLKKGIFTATVMNMTHGKRNDFEQYPKVAVKNEFGADWGANTSVKLDCEFGQGYKYCTLTTIHKDDIGDVYIFYLYDDIEKVNEIMNDLTSNWFYTMTFKKE